MNTTFQLRPAEPRDRAGAYRVCLQTGDNGLDATAFYEDPDALGRIFVGPYFEFEPDLAYVLEDAEGICGYVLGAQDSRVFYRNYVERWLPELQRQYLAPAGDPAGWDRTQKVYHEYHHPDLYCPEPYEVYPSHLHIDLVLRAQGCGWGRRMMEQVMGRLREKGSPGVHLGVGLANERGIGFYRKLGFEELARVRDVLYLGYRWV